MKRLTSIVAVNHDGAIGCQNRLPWRVRSDLQFFRKTTLGNVVIMGRKTFDSLGAPLPGRKNLVVTHGFDLFSETDQLRSAGSIEEALARSSKWCSRREEVYVVGGASMYEQFAPYVDRYLITRVQKPVPSADTFFDEGMLGDPAGWDLQLVGGGVADGKDDEADFEIFEVSKLDPSSERRRRADAVERLGKKRLGNRLTDENWVLQAAGS